MFSTEFSDQKTGMPPSGGGKLLAFSKKKQPRKMFVTLFCAEGLRLFVSIGLLTCFNRGRNLFLLGRDHFLPFVDIRRYPVRHIPTCRQHSIFALRSPSGNNLASFAS